MPLIAITTARMGTISIGRFGEYVGESDMPVSLLMLALMRTIVLLAFCVVVDMVAGLGVVLTSVVLATATFVRLFTVVNVVGVFVVVEALVVRLITFDASNEFDAFVLMKAVFGIVAMFGVSFVVVVVLGVICVAGIFVVFIVVGGVVVVFGAICFGLVDFVVVVPVVAVDVVGIAVISLDGVALVVVVVPFLLISFELLADGAASKVSFCFVVASNGCTIAVCCTSGITVGDTGSSTVSVKSKQTTTYFKLDPMHAGWRYHSLDEYELQTFSIIWPMIFPEYRTYPKCTRICSHSSKFLNPHNPHGSRTLQRFDCSLQSYCFRDHASIGSHGIGLCTIAFDRCRPIQWSLQ